MTDNNSFDINGVNVPVSDILGFLDLEEASRDLVDNNIQALRDTIGKGDYDSLSVAVDNALAAIERFPDHQFLAMELLMMLAANTEGDLLVGMGGFE